MAMQTIKSQLIESLSKEGATHVADTTCWNYHYFNDKSANSNLAKTIAKLPKLEKGYGYLVVVGTKGRSGHSATDLHIFKAKCDGTIGTYECCFRKHWWK